MADTLPFQKVMALKLIAAIDVELTATKPAGAAQAPLPEYVAEVAIVAIRRIIGEAVALFPPGDDRQAMKQALAPLLGNPLGQMLTGMHPRHVAACLEGHADVLATTLGATVSVAVSVHTEPSTPHLKVVQ